MTPRFLVIAMMVAGTIVPVVADAEGFKGFYVDVGAGVRSTTTALTDSIPSIPLTDNFDEVHEVIGKARDTSRHSF
jgi:hypothetical protein